MVDKSSTVQLYMIVSSVADRDVLVRIRNFFFFIFFLTFFAYFFLKLHLHHFSKIKSHKEFTRQ
jgi:hypothetical protein